MIGLIIALLAILVAVTTAVYYKKLQDNAAEAAKVRALKEQAERALAAAKALQEEQERKKKLLEAEQEEERKRKEAEVAALEPPPPPPAEDDADSDSDSESDSEDDQPQEAVISEERRAEIESEQRTLEAEAEAEKQQQLQELSEEQIQRRKAREQKLLQLQRELAGIPAEFVVVRDEGDSGVAWSIKEGGSRFKSLKSVTRGDGSAEADDAAEGTDDTTSAVYDSPRKRRVLTLEKQGSSPAVIVETNTVLQKQLERRNSSGPDSPSWESPRTRRERERKQRRQSRLVDINAIDQNPLLVQRVAKANATKYEPL